MIESGRRPHGSSIHRRIEEANAPVSTRKHAIEERPPAFTYRSGKLGRTLFCDQVEAEALARRFGTPLYVYSASAIRARISSFERAFARQSHTLCFSVKANSNLSVLRLLAALGCGFDVVSGGELQRVIRVSRKAAQRVVFSGVGKTAAEMDAALDAGILLFNVESEAELDLLGARAARRKKTARIAFRVNPNVHAGTHPYISTGLRQHKFGVPIGQARELYRKAATLPYLDPVGVSVHIGSQITDPRPFAETMERVVALVGKLTADGFNISFIDAGGGLGIRYQGPTEADFQRSLKAYAAALMRPLRRSQVHLLLEPGRSIVAASGALLTRALYAKQNDSKQFLVTDAAMNDLMRPSLYGAHHEIVPVTPRTPPAGFQPGPVDVVGPVCESGDFFARDRQLPPVEAGDLLAILDAGAYGMSLSSNYNTRGRAAELLVDGSRVRLIRRRESFDDLVRNEL
jgi:diaminopimelate decarboxylase